MKMATRVFLFLLLLFVLGLFAQNAHGQGVGFDRSDYAAGSQPRAVIIADFNGDGKPDLAVANIGSNNVSILLGNSKGTFSAQAVFNTGMGPASVAAGDFNGDNKLDLVTANFTDNNVSVLLGNGDGTFGAPASFATGNGPVFVVVGDFNGDGKLDLAVANQNSDSISVLLGNGDGTFGAKTDFLTGAQPFWIIVADFNGDSKLDLASANPGSNTVSILLGNGNGTFGTKSDFATGIFPRAVAAADFRKLARMDLATANQNDSTASILLGRGDGTFDPRTDLGTDTEPLAVTAADFDNDGKPDLLTSNAGFTYVLYTHAGYGCCYIYYTFPTVSLLRGNGDGTFSSRTDFSIGASIGISRRPVSVATADLNGDSRIDVVTANEGLNSVSVLLQAPAIGLSTGTLNFPINQAMGTTSPPQTLTVSSTGSFDLAIGAVSIIGTNSGDFSKVADTCSGVAIPSGSNCQVQLTFTPTASGARNATLRIPDNAPGNPHDVNLSGVGVGNGTVSLSPPSLDFGDQFVGTTSAQRQVMLTNTGTGPITVLGISLPNSSFLLGQNCSAPLPASASCTLFVSFSPFSLGPQAAAIRIDSDTLGSPNFVSLNGNGVPAPIVTLTPSSLTFGAQLVGTTSASQTITLSVTGNTLSISSINAIGEFNATHNCGTAVAAGTSCTISVTFQPSGTGTRLGTLIITDNGPGSPHTAALNGTGVTPPNVMLSATSLTFAAQVVSTTSSAQTITLTNMGSAPLTIASIGLTGLNSGDFAATHNCPLSPATLAVNANCTISVTFTPSASGARNASLSVSSDATGSPHSVALSGIGVVGPAASFSPASVTFGNQPVNTPSTPRSVTLTNSGSANLIISAIALTNGSVFSQTNNCPGTLAPAASCLFNLTFTPLGALTYVGSLSVTDNAPGSPHRVALTGNGADFSISVSPGTPTSATIQAGQSATFTLGLASTGFSGTVALACSHSIPLGTCVVSPSSVVLGGSGSPSATITVTTTAHALLPTGPGRPSPPIFYWREVLPWLVLLMSVPLLLTGKKERRRPALAFCVVMLCALFGAACAGGKASPLPGTPPGAYTITVNASSSGAVRSVALSVVVR